ncbi:MAG: bacteriochlorophyll 4-vinyl reductase [Paracoccaceae bacterium]|nr:MAG: bacteriochlorophyll 4-vinyl reductase [Paracoccaceae bacterium]
MAPHPWPAAAGARRWRKALTSLPVDLSAAAPVAGAAPVGLIGPNALLQLVPVLDRHAGRAFRDQVFAQAGVAPPPPDAGMWPEAEAAAVHRTLRALAPGQAAGLLRLAGQGVADYVRLHRIPAPVRTGLRLLPGAVGARLLAAAIDRHAWTFAGSGGFRIATRRPLVFEIARNPLIAGEVAPAPLCHWHVAVFERLFRSLVWPRARVEETCCAAMGAPCCRFAVYRS